jgi:hypothetical protein
VWAARATALIVNAFSPPRFHSVWAAFRIFASSSGLGCLGILFSAYGFINDVYITLSDVNLQGGVDLWAPHWRGSPGERNGGILVTSHTLNYYVYIVNKTLYKYVQGCSSFWK